MRRVGFFRILVTLASTSVVAATLTTAVGAESAGPAAAAGACTFNGVAANGVLTGVTPGSKIGVACTGLPPKTLIVIVQAGPLAGLLPSADSEDEADITPLFDVQSTASGTLPAGTAFPVPNPFKASDPDAACPLSVSQVNAGLVGCTLAVADFAMTDFGNITMVYASQPSPRPPTLALGAAAACAGDQVTVEDGAGPGNWWGNADSAVKLSPPDVTVGGVHPGSTTATISATQYSITTVAGKVVPGPFVAPKLSGTFTVPTGVAGDQPVTVTEPNTTLLPGTISASASLDVLPGTKLAVASISPDRGPLAGGTPVTISGCNFTGATQVLFGTKPAESFHVNSATSITAVSPAGTGTVEIVVVGPSGSSSPTSASAFTYGVQGYDLVGSDGGTFSFGDAHNHGSLPGLGVTPAKPIVGLAATSDGSGYWLAGADGGTFAFGDALNYGSLPGLGVTPAKPIVGIASPDSSGYWLVGADGGTFGFGDAHNYGSLPGLRITPAQPIVGIAATNDGKGYWLVGADGGTFAFGDAHNYGSLPGLGIKPSEPIVGIAATADGKGYWLVGADGGTFAFGDAHNYGSLPGLGIKPAKPIVGIISPDSGGYLLVGADGGTFAFGDAHNSGSLARLHLAAAISGGALA